MRSRWLVIMVALVFGVNAAVYAFRYGRADAQLKDARAALAKCGCKEAP